MAARHLVTRSCEKIPGILPTFGLRPYMDCAASHGSLFLEWVAALLLGIVDSYVPGPKAPPRIRQKSNQ